MLPIKWARGVVSRACIETLRWNWRNNPQIINAFYETRHGLRPRFVTVEGCESCHGYFADTDICHHCNNCNYCCECQSCASCTEIRSSESICHHCNNCNYCCECRTCDDCGEIYTQVCGDCDNCPDCCSCSSRDLPAFINRPMRFWAGEAVAENPSTRMLGVEIETSEVEDTADLKKTLNQWSASVVSDGSISGVEIVTSPASGDRWLAMVDGICTSLKQASADVDSDCGLHVHIDARDFTVDDVKAFLTIYIAIEDALFAMVPPSRRTNTYCVPCGSKFQAILDGTSVEEVVYGKYWSESQKKSKSGGYRYNALNLHSWFYHGTMECRLHPGSTKANKIKAWGVLWALILDAAKDRVKPQGNPYEALCEIAKRSELALSYVKERTAEFAGR